MTTLDPANKKNANVVLSNGNLTITGTDTVNNWVKSTTSKSGKYYIEFTTTTVANTVIGISDTTTIASFPGGDAHSFGLFSNGSGSINGTFPSWNVPYASGNILCMAVDLVARKVWFRVGGGIWNGNAANNPATDVGGFDTSAYTGTTHLVVVSGDNGCVTTVNFGASANTQTPPSGFMIWDAAPVSVTLTGNGATTSVGTVTVATVLSSTTTVTGQSVTVSAGTVAAAGKTSTIVSGQSATVSAGTVSIVSKSSLPVAGQAVTTSVGTVGVTLTGGVTLPLTGQSVTASVGTVAVVGKANISATTPASLISSVGNATIALSVSGHLVTASVNDVTVVSVANVAASGQLLTVSVGTVGTGLSLQATGQSVVVSVGNVSTIAVYSTLVPVSGETMMSYAGVSYVKYWNALEVMISAEVWEPVKRLDGRML